jgi:hypothetical protein
MLHRSREAECPPRLAFALAQDEGAERRKASNQCPRGGAAHPWRGMPAFRRSTAGFVASVPRGMKQEGFTVCELLASARSGGGRGSGASRELRARQRAGRRIPPCPYDASRRAPSADGTVRPCHRMRARQAVRASNCGDAVGSDTRVTRGAQVKCPHGAANCGARRMHRNVWGCGQRNAQAHSRNPRT